MTRTDRRRFPILLASALALLAILGALFLPDRVQAQAIVLVSNIGQTADDYYESLSDTSYHGQAFSVGADGGDYTLTSIEISIQDFGIAAADIGLLSVSVWSTDSSGIPSASLHSLTNPSSIAADTTATFNAQAGASLEAGKTYAVVVYYDKTLFESYPNWATAGTGDDDSPATGWEIADSYLSRGATATNWRTTADHAHKIRVNGSAASGDPPPSCTLNTGDLWCGVMTVGEFSLGPTQGMGRGYRFGQTGSLTDDEFPFDGDTPYRVQAVYYVSEASSSSLPAGTLALTIDLGIPDGLTLQLGNEQFPFSNASSQDGTSIFWSSSGLSWSVADEVTLRLSGEAPPTVTVADATATEGDAVEFVVTLSAVSGRDVMVAYATSETDPQSAVSGTDFTSTSGTLTIAAADNTATGTIQVPTTEDDASESAETFTLTLSNPTNATLGTPSAATGTIENDDVSRLVSNIGQTGTDQSTSATIAQRFTIGSSATASTYTLAGVDVVSISTDEFTAQVCTVDSNGYPTSECTDLMPPDTFAAGTMSFAAPENITLSKGTTYTVVLTRVSSQFGFSPTTSDNEDAGKATGWSIRNEYDFVRSGETAWNQHANRSARIAINGTAVSDAAVLPMLSVWSLETNEGIGMAPITLVLSAAAAADVTVTCTASLESGDTAEADDLALGTTTGTVSAGQTTGSCPVALVNDTTDEEGETFTVTLSDVSSNAQLDITSASVTIGDNDDPPTLSVNDVSGTEGTSLTFTVTLSAESEKTVTVDYATSEADPQSAVSGTDFTAASGKLTFSPGDPGDTTKTITVTTTEDTTVESSETFTLTLSNPTNATLGTPSAATGTINDDDGTTPSTDATLSDLSLGTGVTLSPAFASGTTTYTASVANSVDEVTVTPTTNHASATVEILDTDALALTDADSTEDGFQVALSVGSTQLGVLVMAEDGTTTKFYTVNVTRDDFPNDNTTTGEVEVGGTITGNIGTVGDYDRFKVELEAGTRYQLDLEGADTGRGTLADPHLGLYDNIGSYLQGDNGQQGDDNSGVGVNARMIYTPDASGDFYPVVTEINDNLTGTYTLSVIVLGANGASEADTDFPHDTTTTGRVEVGASVTGNMYWGSDFDWFRVDLEAGKTYQFDLEGSPTGRGSLEDPFLQIFDASGSNKLAEDNNGGTGANAQIVYTATATGAPLPDCTELDDQYRHLHGDRDARRLCRRQHHHRRGGSGRLGHGHDRT